MHFRNVGFYADSEGKDDEVFGGIYHVNYVRRGGVGVGLGGRGGWEVIAGLGIEVISDRENTETRVIFVA